MVFGNQYIYFMLLSLVRTVLYMYVCRWIQCDFHVFVFLRSFNMFSDTTDCCSFGSDIFDGMFPVKHSKDEVVIQQG